MDTPDVAGLVEALTAASSGLDNAKMLPSIAYLIGSAATALQSLSLELERVKSERDEAREASDEFMREMSTMADSIEAALARANAAEAESARLREALSRIVAADDDFRASMAPSVAKDPVTIACDAARDLIRARPDMEGGKL